jgi:hypothetical protein
VNTMILNNFILMHPLRMRRRLAEAKNRCQGSVAIWRAKGTR